MPVSAANWFEKGIYLLGPKFDSQLPACDAYWALSTIKQRFSTKEGRFWNSDLQIVNFDNNQHGANENLRIENLWEGIESMAALLTMSN